MLMATHSFFSWFVCQIRCTTITKMHQDPEAISRSGKLDCMQIQSQVSWLLSQHSGDPNAIGGVTQLLKIRTFPFFWKAIQESARFLHQHSLLHPPTSITADFLLPCLLGELWINNKILAENFYVFIDGRLNCRWRLSTKYRICTDMHILGFLAPAPDSLPEFKFVCKSSAFPQDRYQCKFFFVVVVVVIFYFSVSLKYFCSEREQLDDRGKRNPTFRQCSLVYFLHLCWRTFSWESRERL